jgi:hypothetical protein
MTGIGWSVFGASALGVVALSVWAYDKSKRAVGSTNGKVNADGIVPGDPAALASAAGLSLDVYALARMGASEESSEAGQTAVMWAARNQAQRNKESIAALLLRSKNSKAAGHFGTQRGRYATTEQEATARSKRLAAAVIAGKIADPTGGANQWDAPEAQAKAHARDPQKYKSPEVIAAKRNKVSLLVMVPGVTSTRFWKPRAAV